MYNFYLRLSPLLTELLNREAKPLMRGEVRKWNRSDRQKPSSRFRQYPIQGKLFVFKNLVPSSGDRAGAGDHAEVAGVPSAQRELCWRQRSIQDCVIFTQDVQRVLAIEPRGGINIQ